MSQESAKSIVLTGMPGAGKSTLGVLLAKKLGRDFIDTDLAIQVREGKTLQSILDAEGYQRLRQIEEEVLLAADIDNKVVATGGSVVYSAAAMARLKQNGVVIFLEVPIEELQQRITDYEQRGVARRPDQSFGDLFKERRALYVKTADSIVDCAGKSIEQLLDEILALPALKN